MKKHKSLVVWRKQWLSRVFLSLSDEDGLSQSPGSCNGVLFPLLFPSFLGSKAGQSCRLMTKVTKVTMCPDREPFDSGDCFQNVVEPDGDDILDRLAVSLLCSPRAAYICLIVRRIVSISHDVTGQVEARLTPMIWGTLDLLYRSNGFQRIDTQKLCILPFCRESVMKALHERQAHMHEPLATVYVLESR